MAENNPEINKIKPFLALAKEYESFFPVATFYLKQFAVSRLMEIYKKMKSEGHDDPAIKQTLNAWIGEIESMKQKYGASLQNKEENLKQIEDFTLTVFLKADEDERTDNYSVETIRAFQACSKLFEILNYLGVPSEEHAKKKKYSMAKAIEINKKIKNPELYRRKKSEETKIEEEFSKSDQEIPKNVINATTEIKQSMVKMNQTVRNNDVSNQEKESVDRILSFIETNRQVFEKFGLSMLKSQTQSKVGFNNNQSNYHITQAAPQNTNPNTNNMKTPPINNNLHPNNQNMNTRNEQKPDVKTQFKSKEMASTIAMKKINEVSIREKIQKECQNAISNISSNRIFQAKGDLEKALNYLSELKK